MTTTLLIRPSEVSMLKKQAKRLQRASGRPHHEILDQLARDTGFASWHHLTLVEAETSSLEAQVNAGLYVLLDRRDADSLDPVTFAPAPEVVALRRGDFMRWLNGFEEAGDKPIPVHELWRFLTSDCVCLRYTNATRPPRKDQLNAWMREHRCVTLAFLLRGTLIDRREIDDPPMRGYRKGKEAPGLSAPSIDDSLLSAAFGSSSADSRLVLHSPASMHRFEGETGGGPAWNWCLHCGRAYPMGSFRIQGDLQMCPYRGCDGDAFLDLWEWRSVQAQNPGYPDEPELSVKYPLYGSQSSRKQSKA